VDGLTFPQLDPIRVVQSVEETGDEKVGVKGEGV
jgi:hypothetical protein